MAVIRLLLVAFLTTALLAAALPAIDDARDDVARRTAHAELADLTAAIHATAANDPVPQSAPGAQRLHRLHVPDPGPATTGLDWIAIGATPNTPSNDGPNRDVIAYKLPNGRTQTVTIVLDIRVVIDGQVRSEDTPLLIRTNTRLRLAYVLIDGRPVIRITRVRF